MTERNHRALQKAVEAIRSSQPPEGMTVRIVAVDGPGGAGKSSLSAWLASELNASILHTDDFASWENPTNWWPNLIEQALKPLASGDFVRFRPSSWDGSSPPEVEIGPGEFIILEGVTSSREAFRPYLAYSIWVETPRPIRLRRGLERDGQSMREQWETWMEREDRYIERERPAARPDLVLPGDQDLWGESMSQSKPK